MKLHVFTDGGARGNPGPAATGYVILNLDTGDALQASGSYLGVATNNQAEYQALLEALDWIVSNPLHEEVDQVECFLDSQLVVEQLNRRFKIKDHTLRQKALQIWQLANQLSQVTFQYIPRSQNAQADSLVNQTLDHALL